MPRISLGGEATTFMKANLSTGEFSVSLASENGGTHLLKCDSAQQAIRKTFACLFRPNVVGSKIVGYAKHSGAYPYTLKLGGITTATIRDGARELTAGEIESLLAKSKERYVNSKKETKSRIDKLDDDLKKNLNGDARADARHRRVKSNGSIR